MKKQIHIFLCACLLLSGCSSSVSQKEYDAMAAEKEALQEEYDTLKDDFSNLHVKYEKLLEETKITESQSINEASSGSNDYENFVAQKENKDLPSDIEIISYAQTVLEDYYPKCKLPSGVKEYEITNTALRYKIEGEMHRTKESVLEEFVMIIEFEDESCETYFLVSLQIGDDVIYE